MAPSAALVLFFQVLMLVGTAVTSIRLYGFGLHRKYRVFFSYLIFWTFHNAITLTIPVRSAAYFKFWIVSEPIVWVFNMLLVLELYSLVLQNHKGVYTLGRWALHVCLVIAMGVAGLSLIPNSDVPLKQGALLQFYYVAERGLDTSVVVFLLILVLLLARYPISLSRNVLLHAGLFSTLFLSNTLGLLLLSLVGVTVSRPVSVALMGVSAGCVLMWLIFMDERGEKCAVRAPAMAHGQEERLVTQLNALNTTLLRASRPK